MDDREYKHRKWLLISEFVLFLLILAITFWGTYQIKNLKNQLTAYKSTHPIQKIIIHDGPAGKNGVSIIGADGRDGKNGKDGQNITPRQIASAVADYMKVHPDQFIGGKGDAGSQGLAGKQIVLCLLQDGTIGFKYDGDLYCQPPEGS